MNGLILALLASLALATTDALVRRGVHRSKESFSAIPIFAFFGSVFFTLTLVISGKAGELISMSWLGIGSLATAGVLHFVIGRMLAFTSYRLIGVNRAAPILTARILLASVLGVCFLGERLTVSLILAIMFMFVAVILISTKQNSKTEKPGMPEGLLVKGLFAALGGALCWGISPVLIKIGVDEAGSSFQAVFVSYIAASVVAGGLLFHPGNRAKLCHLKRNSLVPLIAAAVFAAVAQPLRYTALNFSPVSVVTPLLSTGSLFVFPLSFAMNRKIEAFNLRIIIGAVTMVAGVFLMFWAV